jgi:hypothetical protein
MRSGFLAACAACGLLAVPARADDAAWRTTQGGKSYLQVSANAAGGFNFPYILYMPQTAAKSCFPNLLVETNNSGVTASAEHDLLIAVQDATDRSLGNTVAEALGAPLLMPVFPRPATADGNLYTHSLSREAILVPSGPLKRPDQQLVGMIDDAQLRLRAIHHPVARKIIMSGFSASSMFGTRFVYLHPDLVRAATFGGVNSFVMMPLAHLHGTRLNYPLGLADYQQFTGHSFDRRAYDAVAQFIYMGENDTNDAVQFDDSYSPADRRIIYTELGEHMLPGRWAALQQVFREQGSTVSFATYKGIGHGTNGQIHRDLVKFYLAATEAGGEPGCSAVHTPP